MILRLVSRFSFVYNPHTLTYERDHQARVTYCYYALHRHEQKRLADFLHQDMKLIDFFPRLNRQDTSAVSRAWIWLGKFYTGYGKTDYARECFHQAIMVQPTLNGRCQVTLQVGYTRMRQRATIMLMRTWVGGSLLSLAARSKRWLYLTLRGKCLCGYR